MEPEPLESATVEVCQTAVTCAVSHAADRYEALDEEQVGLTEYVE